jgi:hypothetical protein
VNTTEAFTPLPVEEPFFAPNTLIDAEPTLNDEDTEVAEPVDQGRETLSETEQSSEASVIEEPSEFSVPARDNMTQEEAEDLSGLELTAAESNLIAGLNNAAEQSDELVSRSASTRTEVEAIRRRETSESLEAFENFTPDTGAGERTTPQLDASSLHRLAQSFGQQSPSNMARSVSSVNEHLTTAIDAEKDAVNAGLPSIEQPTGLEPGSLDGQDTYVPPPLTEGPDFQSPSGTEEEIRMPETPQPVRALVTSSINQPTTPQQLVRAVEDVDAEVSVNTSMGERPRVPLEGESDLTQMDANERSASLNLFQNRTEEIRAFQVDFGENEVYPDLQVGELSSSYTVRGLENLPSFEGTGAMLEMLPEDEALLNEDVLMEVEEQRNSALAESDVAQQEFEAARQMRIDDGINLIREEETLVTGAQIGIREENRATIQSYREGQSEEVQGVYDEYLGEVASERDTQDLAIEAEIRSAESEADSLMEGGEEDAQRMEREAQVRVEGRRRRAEEEAQEESWFDRAISAVTDFFEELKAAIAAWIDDLRKSVKALFDRIKQMVVDAIDAARDYIVAAIRSFGEALKRLSNLALSRFPEIRDRFNSLIDQSMDWAEQKVNEFAENLKAFAIHTLDTIAAGIDQALVLFQEGLFIILDVFEAIAKFALEMAEAFYEEIMYRIRQIGTLIGLMMLINAGFFLMFAWHFLGEKQRERAINYLLDKAIELFDNAPDDFNRGFLWPLFVNMMIGFLYELKQMPMETKMDMMDKIAGILFSGAFWLNFIFGIFKGIWDNIWGIIEGIWMLLRFIFYDLWVTIAHVMDVLEDIAPDVIELVRNFSNDVHTFIKEFMEQGEEKIKSLRENMTLDKIQEFLEGLADDLRVKAQVMGARGAQQFKDFILSDDAYAVIGDSIGRVIGYLIVEILLLVFTVGIGTAIKWGLKGVKVAVRFAKIFRNIGRRGGMLSSVIRLFGRGIRWLIRAIVKAAEKLAKFAKAVMQRFRRIFQNLQRKIDDILAKLTGQQPNRRPHGQGHDDNRRRGQENGHPRRRNDDGDPDRRRRREDETSDEWRWQEFVREAVPAHFRRFQQDGISESRAASELASLRRRPRFRRVVGRALNSVRRDKGWYDLYVRKTGGVLQGVGSKKVERVPVIRRIRWQLGKNAIERRVKRLRDSQLNQAGIRNAILPFKDDYKYSQLKVESDQRENDWNIMGAMSATKIVAEIDKDLEGLHFGTYNDPIPIHWYVKPQDYPAFITLNINDTPSRVNMYSNRFVYWRRTMNSTSERYRIGVSRTNEINVGKPPLLKKRLHPKDDLKRSDYRRLLSARGYRYWSGKDVDHVRDSAFGGEDEFHNFWPLNSSINQRPFTWWNRNYIIRYKKMEGGKLTLKERRLIELSGKWFKVIGFRYPPPLPGGSD